MLKIFSKIFFKKNSRSKSWKKISSRIEREMADYLSSRDGQLRFYEDLKLARTFPGPDKNKIDSDILDVMKRLNEGLAKLRDSEMKKYVDGLRPRYFKMRPKMKHEEKVFMSCDVAAGQDLSVYQFWMRTPEGQLKLIKQTEVWRGCANS